MTHAHKRTIASAALAVTAPLTTVASQAGAAVISTVTDLGHPTITNASTGAVTTYPGLEAFDLTVATTDGTPIAAVNFGGTASSPGLGLFSTSFLQRALLSTDPDSGQTTRTLTPQATQENNSGSSFSFDSHWLTPGSQTAAVAAPAEDNNGVNLTAGPADNSVSDYGTGSVLTETVGILGAFQSSTLDLAYVVIPTTSTATYSGLVSAGGVATPVAGTFSTAVPEPALGLAGVAAAALLGRRRRA